MPSKLKTLIHSRLTRLKKILGTEEEDTSLSDKAFSDEDLAYMGSLSAAIMQREPKPLKRVLTISAVAIFFIVLGMAIFELDITVRGEGKIIPSQQVQVVQSLEGGVISEILVHEGEQVNEGQPVMRISDIAFTSSYMENRQRFLSLKAKIARLRAEALGEEFKDDEDVAKLNPALMQSERSLYQSNIRQFEQNIQILDEQVLQAENELQQLLAKEKQLQRSVQLIRDELDIKRPLVKKQLVSEVEFLQLRRQASELEGEFENVSLSIPRIESKISEAKRKREEARFQFESEAKSKLNDATSELAQLSEAQTSLLDRVKRTVLRAPVHGTVQRLHINTVGGVIKPGSDVIEIVPIDDALLVEAKIKPADIANIDIGQMARVKFTAYDFAIYGSLEGKVTYVAADTITNEKDETYYIARIRPEKNYFGNEEKPLPIKVGMTSQVDILTGKRTILNYLLKPITRGLRNSLQEP